jgi:DNA processing protein
MDRDRIAQIALALGPQPTLAHHDDTALETQLASRWADRQRYHLWRKASSLDQLLQRVRWMLRQLSALGARVVLGTDAAYPAALRRDPSAPALLFVQGELPSQEMVAIVGTRAARLSSVKQTARLAAGLVEGGVGILSGGALGVDTAAHEGALGGGGLTVAVLGSGLDRRYPERNAALFDQIATQGAVVTTFAPGTPPLRPNFPRRNRVIAAWAQTVVVVEAPFRSGALNTARQARELGTPVLAMPAGAGARALLQRGLAAEVSGAAEVLAALRGEGPRPRAAHPEDPDQQRVHTLLSEEDGGLSVDGMAGRLGWTAPRTAAALIRLELAGLAARQPGGLYTAWCSGS